MGVVRGAGQSACRRLKRWGVSNSTSTLQVSSLAASLFLVDAHRHNHVHRIAQDFRGDFGRR